jgi:hypothetical protein
MPAPKNPARGIELPHAKLTPSVVADMRVRNLMGVSCKRMAAQYGVHVNTVQRAVNYTNWWHR